MKKLFLTQVFTFGIILMGFAQAQQSIPEAPKKVEFANILIELNTESQKLVNAEINKLLTPQNKFLDQKLERMQWYFPIIEKILEEENVPEDFKYLAVLESSLLPEAISSSNAVGFWQFKEATAREMGLRVDNNVDDRKNLYNSTRAAALYIKKNNLIYKNWVSCILSYNQGVSGASENIPVEWSFASEIKFDESTHPYLIKALAHRIAYEHRLNRIKDSPSQFIEYPTRAKSFAEIAVELSVDINELRKYNPWLYAPNIPDDKDYTILILSRIEDVDEIGNKIKKRLDAKGIDVGFPQLKRITMVSTSPDAAIFYEINGKKGILAQPGDEVAQMARKSKLKIGKFLSYNDMGDRDIAKEGQIYYLQKKNKKAKVPYHTVSGEQTIWDVAQMYGVQQKYLLKYNRMKSTQRLQAGRVLWLQKTRPKNQAIEIIQEAIPTTKEKLPVKEDYSTKKEVVVNEPKSIDKKEETFLPEKVDAPKKEDAKKVADETVVAKTPEKKTVIKEENTKTKTNNYDALTENDALFSGGKNTSKTNNNSKSKTITHTVKQGETLFSLSKKYGLTVDQLRRLNNLSANESLKYNQVLKVSVQDSYEEVTKIEPPKQSSSAPVSTKSSPENNTIRKTHQVSAGETLFSISKKYNTTVQNLQRINGLSDNSISLGQVLVISGQNLTPSNNTPISSKMHKVVSGETLFSISKKYGVTLNDLRKWNNITDNTVKLGQNLKVQP
jgi:membrane-bound lytic murein transglycosylase D